MDGYPEGNQMLLLIDGGMDIHWAKIKAAILKVFTEMQYFAEEIY